MKTMILVAAFVLTLALASCSSTEPGYSGGLSAAELERIVEIFNLPDEELLALNAPFVEIIESINLRYGFDARANNDVSCEILRYEMGIYAPDLAAEILNLYLDPHNDADITQLMRKTLEKVIPSINRFW